MNQADFVELHDFIYPDKISIQVDDEYLDLTEKINDIIKKLRYIETPECKALMDKATIDDKRKKYTIKFKYLLKLKEIQNAKPKLND